MEIYRELYQTSKDLPEFTNKVKILHTLMKQEDWKETIPYINKRANQATVQRKELEDFIQSLLDQQKEESEKEGFKRGFQDGQQITKQELLKKLTLKKENSYKPGSENNDVYLSWDNGYNQAIQDLEQLKQQL